MLVNQVAQAGKILSSTPRQHESLVIHASLLCHTETFESFLLMQRTEATEYRHLHPLRRSGSLVIAPDKPLVCMCCNGGSAMHGFGCHRCRVFSEPVGKHVWCACVQGFVFLLTS